MPVTTLSMPSTTYKFQLRLLVPITTLPMPAATLGDATCHVDRRVELVLLHGPDAEPQGTAAWLDARPHLARHHHIRLTHPKVPP